MMKSGSGKFFVALCFCSCVVTANTYESGEKLARRLHLNAASKARIQWERVFKDERKKKRYGIDALTSEEQTVLKRYLIDHAVDSDHPTVAGE